MGAFEEPVLCPRQQSVPPHAFQGPVLSIVPFLTNQANMPPLPHRLLRCRGSMHAFPFSHSSSSTLAETFATRVLSLSLSLLDQPFSQPLLMDVCPNLGVEAHWLSLSLSHGYEHEPGRRHTTLTVLPICGAHQQYPLTDLVKNESTDGREKGVAVIVSINKLRNDAWKLPEDILDKAELQVPDCFPLPRYGVPRSVSLLVDKLLDGQVL